MTIQDDEGFDGVEFDTPIGSFRAGGAAAHAGPATTRVPLDPAAQSAEAHGVLPHAAHLRLGARLALIDWATGGGWWVQWVALIGGVVVALRFLSIFVFDSLIGREAERRMIESELRKRETAGRKSYRFT